jgi:hypothetical protein
MDNFSHNAVSATWSIFQSRACKNGVNRGQSGSPTVLLFDRNDCTLSVRLEAPGISCQITSESRIGFPKPIRPMVFEVGGSRDKPEIVGKDGEERTPEEVFDYLIDWRRMRMRTSLTTLSLTCWVNRLTSTIHGYKQ